MANLYNMPNTRLITDIQIVAWKGKTFSQVSSIIKQNKTNMVGVNLFAANPTKLYRREIASNVNTTGCNSRTSVKIDEINRPSGTLIYPSSQQINSGLVNTIEIPIPQNSSDKPSTCSSCNTTGNTNTSGKYAAPYAFSPTQNALKRVRSSGMIKRQFDISKNNKPSYYTNTKQYLISRNLTQSQNEFNYLSKSNTANSAADFHGNRFYGNGLTTCGTFAPVYYKPSNSQFAQQGGVSASSYITRVKYDSITRSSEVYRKALGASVADALAYGVSDAGYTVKDHTGYPNTKTPIVDAKTGAVKSCTNFIYRYG
jgi:hypothetical protein